MTEEMQPETGRNNAPAGDRGMRWSHPASLETTRRERQAAAPSESLRAITPSSQSPMPGWLHWLESTAIPATPAVFGPSRPEPAPVGASEGEESASILSGSMQPEPFAALLHDARSMVTALDLYCDLLAEPGVLATAHRHYAGELRMVASSSRRLLDQLDELATSSAASKRIGLLPVQEPDLIPGSTNILPSDSQAAAWADPESLLPLRPHLVPSRTRSRFVVREPISSLADELMAMRNLLAALAGPAITLGLSLDGGYRPIAMVRDDLTRVMVNLVRNAADAMPEGGHLQITLRETGQQLELTISDTGCGLPEGDLEAIFAAGYTTHLDISPESETQAHRGIGLAIVQELVTDAGGRIQASNRPASLSDAEEESSTGAVFQIGFPLIE